MTPTPSTFFLVDNACWEDPCGYNGICIDGADSFTCVCYPGFIGEWCQFGKLM